MVTDIRTIHLISFIAINENIFGIQTSPKPVFVEIKSYGYKHHAAYDSILADDA